MKDYSKMTTEQLAIEQLGLMGQREEIKKQQQAIAAVLEERKVEIVAKDEVDKMDPRRKEALRQALSVEGIPSEERVNGQ